MTIGFLGTPGRVFGLATKSFEQSFSQAGGNTGNLLFQYASSKVILGKRDFFGWDVNPDVINNNCSVLVLPLANQLGTHTDYSRRAEFISNIKVPIIAIGLGAQSHSMTDSSAKKLSEKISLGTKHWLTEISEKSSQILVRGDFTVKVCNYLGVHNVESFGCPSNLISAHTNLGERLNKKFLSLEPKTVILNAGFYTKGKNNYSSIVELEKNILSDHNIIDTSIVVQAPKDVMSCSYNNSAKNVRVSEVCDGIINRARLDSFYDVDSWSHHTRNFDMSLGTRIHGSMLSLQFTQPSLLVTHDSRTEELSNIMHIPRITLNEALSCTSVYEMLESMVFDYTLYDERRSKMARMLYDIIKASGLKAAPHIKNMI